MKPISNPQASLKPELPFSEPWPAATQCRSERLGLFSDRESSALALKRDLILHRKKLTLSCGERIAQGHANGEMTMFSPAPCPFLWEAKTQ